MYALFHMIFIILAQKCRPKGMSPVSRDDDIKCSFTPNTHPENMIFLGQPQALRNPSIGK